MRLGLRRVLDRLDRAGFSAGQPGRPNDHFLVPMVMGSPLYGTIFATLGRRARGTYTFPAVHAQSVIGAFIWIVIDGTVALLLFLATLATFDHCLGRVSEVAGRSIPDPERKPLPIDPDLDEWLAEKSAEISDKPSSSSIATKARHRDIPISPLLHDG